MIYENVDNGISWIEHLVDAGGAGIDHHVGTKLFDLDGDGDLDIVSIGWDNDKLWIFENATTVSVGTDITSRILTQPVNEATFEPAAANFSVTATGTAPLTYQWRRGGVPNQRGDWEQLHVEPDGGGGGQWGAV